MRIPILVILTTALLTVSLSGCGGDSPTTAPVQPSQGAAGLTITSPAFAHEGQIPVKYTCDGEDISPPLEWGVPPAGTESFALIVDDPAAPMVTWVHWVVANLSSDARGLAEGPLSDADLPDGGMQGTNSWRRTSYGGPCPPTGTHDYHFKLYALDTVLDLDSTADKKDLLGAMEEHILAEAELVGMYARR